ncbi:MAG TPA: TetR/AcrR family transcriptional regulator [Solirubrobacteraceae bacterium]|nr:TetR/AcrR family transcriptional regulator [Solirubrobacteraceae bacterium]
MVIVVVGVVVGVVSETGGLFTENGMRKGRKPVSRDVVEAIQRGRLMDAMVQVVAEHGYAAATVPRVTGRAGMSRLTFYQLFENRADCFLAAFDHALERMRASMVEACVGQRSWLAMVRAGLLAVLELLESEPQLARFCVVAALGVDERVLERRAEALSELAAVLHAGVGHGRGQAGAGRSPLLSEGLVGATFSLVHARLLASPGKPDLVELHGELMSLLVLPYLGSAAASRELTREHDAPTGPSGSHMRARARPNADGPRSLGAHVRLLTGRTVAVLVFLGECPGASNRAVAAAVGIGDEGQMSRLLRRLEGEGVVSNRGGGWERGLANEWALTRLGSELDAEIRACAAAGGAR